MKNITSFIPDSYSEDSDLFLVEDGIYKYNDEFVTSLSFEQEPELGEGSSPKLISQYPLEDILDKFLVAVSDFYEELNNASERICYLEFSSPDVNDIKELRTIIGKHVYNKTDGDSVALVIE